MVRTIETKFELEAARISALDWEDHLVEVAANRVIRQFGKVASHPCRPPEEFGVHVNVIVHVVEGDAVVIKRAVRQMNHECDHCGLRQYVAQRGVIIGNQRQNLITADNEETAILVTT